VHEAEAHLLHGLSSVVEAGVVGVELLHEGRYAFFIVLAFVQVVIESLKSLFKGFLILIVFASLQRCI